MSKFTFNFKKNKAADNIINSLEINGFAKIQNLFKLDNINKLEYEINKSLENPSVCGSFGYAKKDHLENIFSSVNDGKSANRSYIKQILIQVIESYFKTEPIIAELHIKHDEPTPYIFSSSP